MFNPLPWWRKEVSRLLQKYSIWTSPANIPRVHTVFLLHRPYLLNSQTQGLYTQHEVYAWHTSFNYPQSLKDITDDLVKDDDDGDRHDLRRRTTLSPLELSRVRAATAAEIALISVIFDGDCRSRSSSHRTRHRAVIAKLGYALSPSESDRSFSGVGSALLSPPEA
ncbi:hypothetical protein L484_013491 [Morus notabilis]|uniref:Uncharacterized protein n=1 Tax=Morus notabilis TaxID=981085 RepID=W9R0H4_9ROSA|nr:hypothetical protein L484_013491 [Morus notabilis]